MPPSPSSHAINFPALEAAAEAGEALPLPLLPLLPAVVLAWATTRARLRMDAARRRAAAVPRRRTLVAAAAAASPDGARCLRFMVFGAGGVP